MIDKKLVGLFLGGIVVGLWKAGLANWKEGALAGAAFGFLIWLGLYGAGEFLKSLTAKYDYENKKPKDAKEAAYAVWATIGNGIVFSIITIALVGTILLIFLNWSWLQSLETDKKCPNGVFISGNCIATTGIGTVATTIPSGIHCKFKTEPRCFGNGTSGGCGWGEIPKNFDSWQEAKAFQELNPQLKLQGCEENSKTTVN